VIGINDAGECFFTWNYDEELKNFHVRCRFEVMPVFLYKDWPAFYSQPIPAMPSSKPQMPEFELELFEVEELGFFAKIFESEKEKQARLLEQQQQEEAAKKKRDDAIK
jgi:hypothetical protein